MKLWFCKKKILKLCEAFLKKFVFCNFENVVYYYFCNFVLCIWFFLWFNLWLLLVVYTLENIEVFFWNFEILIIYWFVAWGLQLSFGTVFRKSNYWFLNYFTPSFEIYKSVRDKYYIKNLFLFIFLILNVFIILEFIEFMLYKHF